MVQKLFSGRQQCVKYNGIVSDKVSIDFGVYQGSVIGRIMFIKFINDIVKCYDELKYFMYADDACVWSANKNV